MCITETPSSKVVLAAMCVPRNHRREGEEVREMRRELQEVEERLSDVRERLRRRPDLMAKYQAVLEDIEDRIRELLEDLGSDDGGEVEVEEDL